MAVPRDIPGVISDFAAHARSAGVFSDFDGTLSAIVDDPASARPVAGAAEALGALALRYARVGVISGRPGAFLAEYLGERGVALTGLYGLEVVTADGVRPVPEAAPWRRVVEEVAARAEAELPPALGIERKGLSLAVHYRVAPGYGDLARRWAEEAASRTGLAIHPARMSYELRPPLPHDKGLVLAESADGLTHVMFVGDDRGDLEAFDALDRMAADSGVVVARVAVRSPESPAELLDRADAVVDGPEGVLSLFRDLAGAAAG
ncbi:MAG: trehalose 6-phosphate phosphatase [Actinomycetota bacterium]|jgi:trehalose 6-phosphate phosphatase|nr:trehalose 6-phosphate phosphatase [Actinomycetota bacterium]